MGERLGFERQVSKAGSAVEECKWARVTPQIIISVSRAHCFGSGRNRGLNLRQQCDRGCGALRQRATYLRSAVNNPKGVSILMQ